MLLKLWKRRNYSLLLCLELSNFGEKGPKRLKFRAEATCWAETTQDFRAELTFSWGQKGQRAETTSIQALLRLQHH